MLRKYEYRRTLPHYQKDNRAIFITFNTAARWVLSPAARDIVFECCRYIHGKTAALYAVVVMPEHAHLVLVPLSDDSGQFDLATILQKIKSVSAHRINKLLRRRGRVWQEERFDHVLRCEEKLENTVEYVRQNPVRRGLVVRPEDYKWLWVDSTFVQESAGESPASTRSGAKW